MAMRPTRKSRPHLNHEKPKQLSVPQGSVGGKKLFWGMPVISYIDRQGPECSCLLMKVVECLEMAVERNINEKLEWVDGVLVNT